MSVSAIKHADQILAVTLNKMHIIRLNIAAI